MNYRKGNIRYLIRLIDRHGNQVLRKDKNKDYSLSLKEENEQGGSRAKAGFNEMTYVWLDN